MPSSLIPPYGPEYLGSKGRSKSQRRFVKQEEGGTPIMALPMASICCSAAAQSPGILVEALFQDGEQPEYRLHVFRFIEEPHFLRYAPTRRSLLP